jgi:hypothetical protein
MAGQVWQFLLCSALFILFLPIVKSESSTHAVPGSFLTSKPPTRTSNPSSAPNTAASIVPLVTPHPYDLVSHRLDLRQASSSQRPLELSKPLANILFKDVLSAGFPNDVCAYRIGPWPTVDSSSYYYGGYYSSDTGICSCFESSSVRSSYDGYSSHYSSYNYYGSSSDGYSRKKRGYYSSNCVCSSSAVDSSSSYYEASSSSYVGARSGSSGIYGEPFTGQCTRADFKMKC